MQCAQVDRLYWIAGQVHGLTVQHSRFLTDALQVGSGGDIQQVGIAKEETAGCGDRRAARVSHAAIRHAMRDSATLVVAFVIEVTEGSRPPVERGRHRAAARNKQCVPADYQRSLRPDAGKRGSPFGLQQEHRAAGVVRPQHLAGFDIQRVDEHAHERPDARREVDRSVGNHRSPAGRPGRDQSLVTEQFAIRRPATKTPHQLAGCLVDAVQNPVVAREQDAPVSGDRRQPHGTIDGITPAFRSGFRVECHETVFAAGTSKQRLSDDDRFIALIVRHPLLIDGLHPGSMRSGKLLHPQKPQVGGQSLGRSPRASDVIPPHRPVAGPRCLTGQPDNGD